MTNETLKSAIAAVVLAVFNLFAILGLHVRGDLMAWTSTALVLAASYFAPRLSYLSHRYAGAIGAALGGALAGLNLLATSGLDLDRGLIAAFSSVLVALGALFSPSLTRGPEVVQG